MDVTRNWDSDEEVQVVCQRCGQPLPANPPKKKKNKVTPYALFLFDCRDRDHLSGQVSFRDLMRLYDAEWRAASPERKESYKEMARTLRAVNKN